MLQLLLADPLSLLRLSFLRPSGRALQAGLLGALAAWLTLGGATPAALAVNPPNISQFFVVPPGAASRTGRLAIAITNPPGNPVALTGIAVTDNFPAGMVVASPLVTSNTLGGTLTATAGGTSISLTGAGPLTPGNQGSIFVVVEIAGPGPYVNTTGNVSSTEGGTGATASGTMIGTTATIASSRSGASPSGYALPGANVTLKITVSGGGVGLPPVGALTIRDTTTATDLGAATPDAPATSETDTRNYIFTISAAQLAATGTHNLTATYAPNDNGNYTAHTSAVFPLRVGEDPSLTVTTTSDTVDANDNQTSLREALAYANTLTGAQTITFSSSTANGAVNFADGTARTITLGSSGELAINSSVTVTGPGADVLTLDAHQASRVIGIGNAARDVVLSGVTITNGFGINSNGDGAGIFASGLGALTLTNCNITNCEARNARGGGIAFFGARLALISCALSGNKCDLQGGAINVASSSITLINTTLSKNLAEGGDATVSGGRNTIATVVNCTMVGNSDRGFLGGSLRLKNTLFLDPPSSPLPASIVDGGGNVLSGTSAEAGLEVDGHGVPIPRDNGGPTPTIALLPGSAALNAGVHVTTLSSAVADAATSTVVVADATAFPAGVGLAIQIDSEQMLVASKTGNELTVTRGVNGTTAVPHAANAAVNPAFDQRGQARVTGATVDIGAYEYVPAAVAVPTFADGVAANGLSLGTNDGALNLAGAPVGATPAGGTFTGTGTGGTNGATFTPTTLTPGDYIITYTTAPNADGLTAQAQFTIHVFDNTRPSAIVAVATTALPLGSTSLVTIVFTEAVSGLTQADLTVPNGSLTDPASGDGGINWTAILTPASGVTAASNVLTLDNSGVQDAAGNAGVGTTLSNAYAIDTQAPTVAISAPSAASTTGSPVTFTVAYADANLANSTLAAGDITLNRTNTANAQVTVATTGNPRTVTLSNFTGTGTLGFSVAAGTAVDTFGNPAPAAGPSVTVTLTAAISAPTPDTVAAVGRQVPGEPAGTTFFSFGAPSVSTFYAKLKVGKEAPVTAIIAPNGRVLLREGQPAPGLPGLIIASLGEPTGQAVLATLKPGGSVTSANDSVLYTSLVPGGMRVAARTGGAPANTPALRIKSFGAVDGSGGTVFFLATLLNQPVANDLALLAARSDGRLDLLAQEGKPLNGDVATMNFATLVGVAGTLAEGRWRAGNTSFGLRATLPGGQQRLYTSVQGGTPGWAEQSFSQFALSSIGLPAFGPDTVGVPAQLTVGTRFEGLAVSANDDSVLLVRSGGGQRVIARENAAVPNATGGQLPGVRYATLGEMVAGQNGIAAYYATLAGTGVTAGNNRGIWSTLGSGSTPRLVARTGDSAPSGGLWAGFTSLVLPDTAGLRGPFFTGQLAISAADRITAQNRDGLWAVDSARKIRAILRTGQTLAVSGANRVVKSFRALEAAPGSIGAPRGFTEDGTTIAVVVTTNDNVTALMTLPVP